MTKTQLHLPPGSWPPCESRQTLRFHKKGPDRSRGLSYGADDEIRTRDPHLGKVMLYQLSHVRRRRHPTNGGR